MKYAIRIIIFLLFGVLAAFLAAGYLKPDTSGSPSREYTAVTSDRFGFLGVDLLSYIGKPLEQAKKEFHTDIKKDEEEGVAFLDIEGRPLIPKEWGLQLEEHQPTISFLCPEIPDKDSHYSYDMLIHEAGISAGFNDGYSRKSIETLLERAFQSIQIQGGTPQSLAREFMEGNDIDVNLDLKGKKGIISLAHFDGFFYFFIKVTDQADFFG